MRLTSLQVEGYRSLRDVTLDGLGPHVVLYGPNGAGKSNLLDAVGLLFAMGTAAARTGTNQLIDDPRWAPGRDLTRGRTAPAQLRADFVAEQDSGLLTTADRVTVEIVCDPKNPVLTLVNLECHRAGEPQPVHDRAALLAALFPTRALSIPALRETPTSEGAPPEADAIGLALAGRIPEALFLAATSPDVALHARYQHLANVLQAPPFSRPPFRPVQDPRTRACSVQELRDGAAVPLDRAGLGAQQLYAIVAAVLLSGARVVTLEEPEAHLHLPSTALDLRHFLQGIVPDPVEQLFVATHSSLFDLDPTGFWDVSHDDTLGTVVRRSTELVDLDRRHVYEPGAARRALLDALHRGEPDRVVAVRPDGSEVLASEMIRFLVSDDPVAFAFLKDVTEAAVRLVAVRARR